MLERFMRISRGWTCVAMWALALGAVRAAEADGARGAPLVAVMGAFPAEVAALRAEFHVDAPGSGFTPVTVAGVRFERGRVDGREILLFQAGASVVNASYILQMALDHFPVTTVLFGGIAGGIDPSLKVGDVVIPEAWAYHGEAAYLNEDGKGGFTPLPFDPHPGPSHFGMIFPRSVRVVRAGEEKPVPMPLFPVDAGLLEAARRALPRCAAAGTGGGPIPVTVGGVGVSGSVLLDNAPYRQWVFDTWHARCLDMESTAYAQVCWANGKPLLVVRGLSDLAGGQPGGSLVNLERLKVVFADTARVVHLVLDELPATGG